MKLKTEKIGAKLWRLTDNFAFNNIEVPKGFITDGTSIYWMFYFFLARMSGNHIESVITHDYLYSKDSDLLLTRKDADKIFLKGMLKNKTPKIKAYVAYYIVRLLGKTNYKKKYSYEKIK